MAQNGAWMTIKDQSWRFWAAILKGTRACRTQGDFRLSIFSLVCSSIHLFIHSRPPQLASQTGNLPIKSMVIKLAKSTNLKTPKSLISATWISIIVSFGTWWCPLGLIGQSETVWAFNSLSQLWVTFQVSTVKLHWSAWQKTGQNHAVKWITLLLI